MEDSDGRLRAHLNCTKVLNALLRSSKAIRNVSSILDDSYKIECVHCEENVRGGFDPAAKRVLVCENRLRSAAAQSRTLLHELIHAYDDSTKHTNWSDPHELACSEVRAAMFSGECDLESELRRYPVSRWPEMLRARWNDGIETCVRRRSALSVSLAQTCDRKRADEIVDEVFSRCVQDARPFETE